MKNKFLFLSLLFVFGLLILLSYPQISFAAVASVRTGAAGAGLTSANASGTVLSIDNDVTCSGVGFVYGTASATAGSYLATSSLFGSYATSTDFSITLSSLAKGAAYYHRAYCTTTVSSAYGDEVSFLTGVDAPSDFGAQSAEDRIKITWTVGSGSEKTMIRYNDGTTYPTLITEGNQAFWATGTEVTLYNLPKEHTYYFSAWSSTSDAGLTTTSDSYLTMKAATTAASGGGISRVAPTTYSDSLVINEGAATTQTREVTLKLRAGNTSLMSISHDNRFLVPLETYAITKSWTLTEGDGEKTVYAKFVSPDGLNSEVISDTITLKTAVPEEVPVEEVPVEEIVEEVPAVPEEVVEEVPVEKPISEMTIEELKVKIAEIMAQVAALQAQLTELKEVTIEGCTIASFDRNLQQGMSGDDVKCLQIILNSTSDTQVAASGVGSAGNETTYFGLLTKAAVIKFQVKYASDILASWGLSTGTGFLGSSTRAKLNELLSK